MTIADHSILQIIRRSLGGHCAPLKLRPSALAICSALALATLMAPPSLAQDPNSWRLNPPGITFDTPPSAQTVARTGTLAVTALLTDNGQQIKRGLTWRVFRGDGSSAQLVTSSRLPAPSFTLPAGNYVVNVAFGRAYLTKVIEIKGGERKSEQFVMNAGGLRVLAKMKGDTPVPSGSVTYDILSDERDQSGQRRRILTGVRPGLVIRLNSGIYQLVSRMGDANVRIVAEVTVEAGKLTEATFVHDAAKVTFKLAAQAGGEALADVQWIILSSNGAVVKETAGALPSHILAPGTYTVSARWSGRLYTRSFSIRSGDNVEVEVTASQ
ncbi:MAG: hypothetical protein KDJ36_08700 [Hyphomicrobiaceae bacterium]|nr:hypothetical protein [Hyphomicrobiaceae bacterium]